MSKIKANIYVNVFELHSTMGMFVSKKLLDNRRLGFGKVVNYVPGHGGDVWFVNHPDGTQAVYSTEEMVPVHAIICMKCNGMTNISEIQTVADKGIVDLVLRKTDLGVGIYRCECGERIYLLCKKKEDQ